MIFSEIQIREFKEILLKMEMDATILLDSLNVKINPVGLDPVIDHQKRGGAEDQETAKAQVIRTETQLALAKAALKRIETGAYGYCVQCEEAMDLDRLKKRPEASRCLECQQKISRRR